MENFTICNPVKVHFGRGILNEPGTAVSSVGQRVLLVYGQGSILKNSVYDVESVFGFWFLMLIRVPWITAKMLHLPIIEHLYQTHSE